MPTVNEPVYTNVFIIIISYPIVDLKRQNRLKVGTKLKVKMQSVSDDDVRKRLLEKPRIVLSWRRKVYSDWEDVTSSGRAFQVIGPATGKARLPTVAPTVAATIAPCIRPITEQELADAAG